MKVIPLSEGAFTIDQTKLFVPFNPESDDLQGRPVGSLLVEVQPFLVVTSRDVLLLDTGLGFEQGGEMQLYKNLRAANVQPEQVTKVLMSHLHKDHAGGVSRFDTKSGNYVCAFPDATYYIQQKEWDDAMRKGLPSYITPELEWMRQASNIRWLEGDGIIDNYVSYQVTGGHSPFHQVFWIAEDAEKIFFGGDEAPQLMQMKSRFVAKYDYDGKKSMLLRQKWWKEGNTENWTFLFVHDITTSVYNASAKS